MTKKKIFLSEHFLPLSELSVLSISFCIRSVLIFSSSLWLCHHSHCFLYSFGCSALSARCCWGGWGGYVSAPLPALWFMCLRACVCFGACRMWVCTQAMRHPPLLTVPGGPSLSQRSMLHRVSALYKVGVQRGCRSGWEWCSRQAQGEVGRRWPEAVALSQRSNTKRARRSDGETKNGAERRRTRLLLMLVFGSCDAVFSVVLTSDLITGCRLPDQKPLRIRNMLSSWLSWQICSCLNYTAHCKPAATPHLLPVLT